jgi:hypothetical protein
MRPWSPEEIVKIAKTVAAEASGSEASTSDGGNDDVDFDLGEFSLKIGQASSRFHSHSSAIVATSDAVEDDQESSQALPKLSRRLRSTIAATGDLMASERSCSQSMLSSGSTQHSMPARRRNHRSGTLNSNDFLGGMRPPSATP